MAISRKVNISQVEDRLKNGNKLVFYPDEKLPQQMPVTEEPAEEAKNVKKKRKRSGAEGDFGSFVPGVHTLRFRIWASFIIMTVVMLAVTWLVGIFFLQPGYTMLQKASIESLGNEIYKEFVGHETAQLSAAGADAAAFDNYIREKSRTEGCSIFIFNYDDGGNTVVRYSSTTGTGLEANNLNKNVRDWLKTVVEEDGTPYTFDSLSTGEIRNDAIVIYCAKKNIGGVTYYVYVSAAQPSFQFTGFSVTTVLLIVTAVLIISGLLVAYFVSGYASKPVKQLSKEIVEKDEAGERKALAPSGFTEIDELKQAFNKAMDSVESNNRFRRDLLANVSHDMKTPLTMIQAYAEMIRDITAGNKVKCSQNASTIIAETARLNSLINEVVELSKLEAGVAEIQRRSFDYTEKVNEVIGRFVGLNEARGYMISAEVDKGLFVDGDPDTIDRVLYNLIGNAINYTGDDKTVAVIARRVGDNVETHVLDTGKGIAAEDLPAVWDKYYRLAQDKRRVMGSGLGLSIVKTVLEKHRVEYGVISEVGKGSDFYFCLPMISQGKIKP